MFERGQHKALMPPSEGIHGQHSLPVGHKGTVIIYVQCVHFYIVSGSGCTIVYSMWILLRVYGNDPKKKSLTYLSYLTFFLIVTTTMLMGMISMCPVLF